jgi:hypothetical protein
VVCGVGQERLGPSYFFISIIIMCPTAPSSVNQGVAIAATCSRHRTGPGPARPTARPAGILFSFSFSFFDTLRALIPQSRLRLHEAQPLRLMAEIRALLRQALERAAVGEPWDKSAVWYECAESCSQQQVRHRESC